MPTNQPIVHEQDGPKGGEYFYVDLSDGRRISVSRKPGDNRVWLGRPDEAASYYGQPGGIGRIDKLLNEWFSQVAIDDRVAEQYWALAALDSRRTA